MHLRKSPLKCITAGRLVVRDLGCHVHCFVVLGVWHLDRHNLQRYGHGPNGIISITLKPKAMKWWAYSMDTCSSILQDIANMSDHNVEREVTSHVKEKSSRINSDAKDRDKIRDKLLTCIALLYPIIPLIWSTLLLVWFHLKQRTHMTQWILGMGNLCHWKKAGLTDLMHIYSRW